MSLDKQERHEVYNLALEHVYDCDEDVAVCDALLDAADDLGHYDVFSNEETFPEWYAQEPPQSRKPTIYKNTFNEVVDFWWTKTQQGRSARIRALKRCIELTK